jgi:DNA polymerase III subunit epsilon
MTTFRPIFFDLETTGVFHERDRIVEIAAFDSERNLSFQRLVNPGVVIPDEVIRIHGITNEMVASAPSFAEAGKEFIEFCSGKVMLVAHNGELFDLKFLTAEFKRHKLSFPLGWSLVDSLKWARKYRKDLPKHTLQYLRELFCIPKNNAHRALDDTLVLHRVFSLLTDDLTCEEILERGDGIWELGNEKTAQKEKVNAPALELF